MLLLYEYRTKQKKTVVLRIMNLTLMKFSLLPCGLKHTQFFLNKVSRVRSTPFFRRSFVVVLTVFKFQTRYKLVIFLAYDWKDMIV